MDNKFNSLFDNDSILENKPSQYYPIDKFDDTLILTNFLLTFDRQKLRGGVELSDRNFGDSKNYRLGPRSCSTRHASSDKFCETAGLPEVYEEKVDKCKQYFMPNSSIGERSLYLQNIDIENRVRHVDHKYSKCDNLTYKNDVCNSDDPKCSLNCGNNLFGKDNTFKYQNTGLDTIKKNNQDYCNYRKKSFSSFKQNFKVNKSTKRINTVQW